jgi:hypothetical protein
MTSSITDCWVPYELSQNRFIDLFKRKKLYSYSGVRSICLFVLYRLTNAFRQYDEGKVKKGGKIQRKTVLPWDHFLDHFSFDMRTFIVASVPSRREG